MVKLRLARFGAKKKPFYRIIAADSKARREGKFLEVLGTYDPKKNPVEVILKEERVRYWLKVGAQPTATVWRLLKKNLPQEKEATTN